MYPGQELDHAVAQKVFKLRPFKKHWQDGGHGGYLDAWLDEENREKRDPLPEYSKNMAAAWLVAEHVRLAYGYFHFSITQDADGITAGFGRNKDSVVYATGQYFPQAVCLAALKAVGAC